MTPTQIEEAARRRYNSVGDTFWSSDEIMQLMTDACLELAKEALVIEATYTTSTVVGQIQFPSGELPTRVKSLNRSA